MARTRFSREDKHKIAYYRGQIVYEIAFGLPTDRIIGYRCNGILEDGCPCNRVLDIDLMEVDHKYPIARGGRHNPDNLQLLCPRCNRAKGSKVRKKARKQPPAPKNPFWYFD